MGEVTEEEVDAEVARFEEDKMGGRRMPKPGEWTQDEVRHWLHALSEHVGDWQGIPVPLGKEHPLVLRKNHPMHDFFVDEGQLAGAQDDDDGKVINGWFDLKRNRKVWVVEDADGRRSALTLPTAPDQSMRRLTFWLSTIGAADAWEPKAEYRAREHLRSMLTERQWQHYDLTGAFFETSPRSKLTYVFRRLRPTIVLSPRTEADPAGADPEHTMLCIAVLCLHPIGYYADSWGGCMVPTDDVIAHLTLCRADEADFWGQAVQHRAHEPEAGI